MAFPPVRTFIVHRSNWYSRTGTVALTDGELLNPTEFPLSNLIDGSMGPMCRWASHGAGVRVTLSGSPNANILGILNHNLDPNLLIQPYINGTALSRTFSVAYPHCWIDLRGFAGDLAATGIPVSSAEVRIYGNSKPIAFSELVVAGAYLFNGVAQPGYDRTASARTSRRRTEYGSLLEAGMSTLVRALRLNLQQVSIADSVLLQNIWDDVGEHGEKVLVVPTSRANDIWLTRWPAQRAMTFPLGGQYVEVPLDLVEEAGGVLP